MKSHLRIFPSIFIEEINRSVNKGEKQMKTRMIFGTLIFFIFFGLGSTVQKTQGHCSWDVFVVRWTTVHSRPLDPRT